MNVDDEYQSIVCPACGKRSYNPNDVEMRYCGNCHRYHVDMRSQSSRPK